MKKEINKINAIYLGVALIGLLLTLSNALYSIVNKTYSLDDLITDILYFVAVCMFVEILYLGIKREN